MRKLILSFIICILCFGMLPACAKIEQGEVGVKVKLLGSNKGVDAINVLSPGYYWVGWNEEVHEFPVSRQTTQWTANPAEGSLNNESITFNSTESLSINADIGVTYQVDPAKAGILFQTYRKGIDQITDVELRNIVRDAFSYAASTRLASDIIGPGKQEFLEEATKRAKDKLKKDGIIIETISIIGAMRPPNQLIQAINAKVEATQKAEQRENELKQAEAEAAKTVAEAQGKAEAILAVANAQAKANETLRKSLSPELVQYEMVKRWDGVLPKVSGSDGLINMVDLNK